MNLILMKMNKMKQPEHCKNCLSWHRAGHLDGTRLCGSKYDNWCCKLGKPAYSAVGECRLKHLKENKCATI